MLRPPEQRRKIALFPHIDAAMSAAADLFRQYNGICFYCREPKRQVNYTRDHFIPRTLGGDGASNDVGACRRCNVAKGNFDPRQLGLTSPFAITIAEHEALRKLRALIRYADRHRTSVAQIVEQGRTMAALDYPNSRKHQQR